MGYYINPPNGQSKEAWLQAHGKDISTSQACEHSFEHDECLPVCLVDNGWMTAAAIAYDEHEVKEFARPTDHRSKRWYLVPRADLVPYYARAMEGLTS